MSILSTRLDVKVWACSGLTLSFDAAQDASKDAELVEASSVEWVNLFAPLKIENVLIDF